ncbi:hypothetical protein ABLG96_12290 [Nakamurella sp. A5-74]|uniref:DUF998 domain-containing protein n=1 Tax=Nakamurella sp. A5-74 TaxID=3158264 RepID=A0AAU8DMC7_9ACTN
MIDPTLRRRLLPAGALALLALGLPWTTASFVPGYYSPGFCTTTYDADGYGSMYCSTGFIGAGYNNPASPGFTIDVRVYAALMLIAAIWGLRRRSPVLLGIALTAGAAALVRNPGSQAGQLVWAGALVLAGVELVDAGLLRTRSQAWLSRRRRQLPPPRGSRPAAPHPRAAPGAAHR